MSCHSSGLSHRYLNLHPVVGDLAQAEGLIALRQGQLVGSQADQRAGLRSSVWIVLARSASDFGTLPQDRRWYYVEGDASEAWTDDFSNIWSVFNR